MEFKVALLAKILELFEACAIGDVTEAPHASDDGAVDTLGHGVSLEHAPVFEQKRIVTFCFGLRSEFLKFCEEHLRPGQLVEDECDGGGLVTGGQNRVRQSPHLDEAAVGAGDLSIGVDDEDAVGGRVKSRGQKGQGIAQSELGGRSGGDVMSGD